MVVHAYNSKTWEAEARKSGVRGPSCLQSKLEGSLGYLRPYLKNGFTALVKVRGWYLSITSSKLVCAAQKNVTRNLIFKKAMQIFFSWQIQVKFPFNPEVVSMAVVVAPVGTEETASGENLASCIRD